MEKLKIEAGKFYRTRSGAKAFVAMDKRNPFNPDDEYPILAYIDEEPETNTHKWLNPDGREYASKEYEHDLVAEWREPKRIKGWLNVYLPGDGRDEMFSCVHKTREKADAVMFASERIACIEIDVLEGQGLDGSAR
ncbi:hypothetical protein [Bradyrhizobium manausense]|uniref:hypothetical protein n=1 Tax=Bradyrhizobium manausense TaxID=989370 RepID=UPI001BAAFEC9|nr:hypothetical protein [Bradyrhizobium manausense]MBR0721781.1 hypothetical protein [Bradyrhizobium manausense]